MHRYLLTIAPTFSMLFGFFHIAGLLVRARAAEPADAAAVAAIRKIGGSVRPMRSSHEDWKVDFHLRGRELTDEGLVHIAALTNVVSLDLRETKIELGKRQQHVQEQAAHRSGRVDLLRDAHKRHPALVEYLHRSGDNEAAPSSSRACGRRAKPPHLRWYGQIRRQRVSRRVRPGDEADEDPSNPAV